jgi:hypothetical protein
MRPGQLEPNDFEIAILERLAHVRPALRPLIPHLHVLSREFTGRGSFTNFAHPAKTAEARDEVVGLNDAIRMPGVPNGMGAVLFVTGGAPKCLETYTFGSEPWDGVYTGFVIGVPE